MPSQFGVRSPVFPDLSHEATADRMGIRPEEELPDCVSGENVHERSLQSQCITLYRKHISICHLIFLHDTPQAASTDIFPRTVEANETQKGYMWCR